MADVLVFAEHKAGHFPKTTLIAVNAGIELAKKRGGGKCIAVIAGEKIDAPAAELAKYGIEQGRRARRSQARALSRRRSTRRR